MRRPNLLSSAFLLGLAACGGAQADTAPKNAAERVPAASASAPAHAPSPSDAGTAPASYADVFTALVARIEKNHVFAPGRRAFWDAHKEELRREMVAATTREAGLVALRHLQLALGDRHCNLSPPTDLQPHRLRLGVSLHVLSTPDGPRVRIAEVEDPKLRATVAVGDEVVSVDGVPIGAYIDAHPFESNALNPAAALDEIVASVVQQTFPWTTVKEGDARVLRLTRAGAGVDHALTFRRPFRYFERENKLDVDDAPDMAKVSCTQEKTPPYAGYDVAAIGANVCVYRPRGARTGKPVVVRYLSFHYASDGKDDDAVLRAIRADHDLLARALEKDARVVVDLRDNHGGNNPFIFVSWFAHGPWGHEQVHVKVSDDFDEESVRSFLWGDDALVASYKKALAEKAPELVYPFLCKKGTCAQEGPRPSELVTKKPVALVTGPDCTSSCDALAALWTHFHVGPVVGKQPMHGFTSVRHAYPVVAPDNRDMGRLRIALSWEAFTDQPTLEGRPLKLDWEAPDTFETRDTWVDAAIEHAGTLLAR